jgi:3-mercaptopyruvate sulfurtransferase SseA
VIVTPEGREQETITRLSRVGFDHVLGYLEGGMSAWENADFETDSMASITPEQFASEYSAKSVVVDARKRANIRLSM